MATVKSLKNTELFQEITNQPNPYEETPLKLFLVYFQCIFRIRLMALL